jgi:hypothetical protein
MLGLFLAVMLFGPALRDSPVSNDSMRLPAMSNVPPPGSLHVELEPSPAQVAHPDERPQ